MTLLPILPPIIHMALSKPLLVSQSLLYHIEYKGISFKTFYGFKENCKKESGSWQPVAAQWNSETHLSHRTTAPVQAEMLSQLTLGSG